MRRHNMATEETSALARSIIVNMIQGDKEAAEQQFADLFALKAKEKMMNTEVEEAPENTNKE